MGSNISYPKKISNNPKMYYKQDMGFSEKTWTSILIYIIWKTHKKANLILRNRPYSWTLPLRWAQTRQQILRNVS